MAEAFKNSYAFQKRSYYVDQFIGLKAAGDMLNLGLFPNAKEITESFAMFEASRKLYPDFKHENGDVTLVCVGDGTKPRTAALFAFLTRWNCVSIDPEMEFKDDEKIYRLESIKDEIQNIQRHFHSKVLVVMPHAHVKLDWLKGISGDRIKYISMPCCIKQNPQSVDIEYRDKFVWSPQNLIKIW